MLNFGLAHGALLGLKESVMVANVEDVWNQILRHDIAVNLLMFNVKKLQRRNNFNSNYVIKKKIKKF